MVLRSGQKFYYANRDTHEAEECVVVDVIVQFPIAYIAQNVKTGERFKCYGDYECFLDKKKAQEDAMKESDRIIY